MFPPTPAPMIDRGYADFAAHWKIGRRTAFGLNFDPSPLNEIGYDGPISVEWEDAGMDRELGAPESLEHLRKLAFDKPSAALDAAFSSER